MMMATQSTSRLLGLSAPTSSVPTGVKLATGRKTVRVSAVNASLTSSKGPLVQFKKHRFQERATTAISATEANFDEGISGTDDYSPLLAVAGFVAVWFNKLSVDRVKLLQGLAVLQLFVTAVNLVTGRGIGDKVSNIIGPGVLAAAVLSIRNVTYLDVATGLFGYFLSQNLEDITGDPLNILDAYPFETSDCSLAADASKVPFYAFLATLAVAIYLNYGTLWYVAFFGIAAAARVYNSTKNDKKIPVIVIPAVAASGLAIYKEAHFPLALCIFLAQTLWSGLKAVDALTKRVKD